MRLFAARLQHILLRMRNTVFQQLGFDFGDSSASEPAPTVPSPPVMPVDAPMTAPTAGSAAPSVSLLSQLSALLTPSPMVVSPSVASPTELRDRPSRGRSATRARTAVLFSRLQDMGLRGVDALVLMRTRTVMVSLIGRTLRVNEGYADAPERVLHAIVAFATARTKTARMAARDQILAFEIDRPPAARRVEKTARPGDFALIAQLTDAHKQLNAQHFSSELKDLPIRLSGRMATRLGHYDPGTKHVTAEIVMSRKHVVKHGWREAMHTLLHEMVHQWQHESGATLDHGVGFRKKAKEVGITPAARRDVMPLERRRRRAVGAD